MIMAIDAIRDSMNNDNRAYNDENNNHRYKKREM